MSSFYSEASSSKHHIHFHHRRHHSEEHDLSALLDPAYSRSRPSSPQNRVFKDTHGQFHDPDYRHFPSSSPNPRSRRVESCIGRPGWELGLSSGLDQEEFEALYNDDEETELTTTSTRRKSTTRRRRHLDSSSSSTFSSIYTPPSPSSSLPPYSPSSMASSLSETELPPYEFSSYYPSTSSSSSCSAKFTKRLSSQSTRSSFEEHVHPPEFSDEASYESEEGERGQFSGGGMSPMKKQWLSMQLSVRIGVFRAQRRLERVLGGKR